MTESEFKKLLKKDSFQVFLVTCPAQIPAVFAIHPWFIVNKKGSVSRWEVIYRRNKETAWGYISENELPPYSGIQAIPFTQLFFWKSKLLNVIEGDENSTAARVAECLTSSPEQYPLRKKYHLLGPNSNTYVQWIIDTFPESGMKLPWNAIGKNFKTFDKDN